MLGTAEALDTASPPDREAPAATVTCVLLLSPLRAADGTWRCHRETFPAGDALEAYLPEGERLARVELNGACILPEHYGLVIPEPGDEVWLVPAWELGPEVIAGLIAIAAGLIVATASHYLFRPKPLLLPQQNQMTDPPERTFSFEGIRTAIGPGAIIPVIYGTHRVGGQLLSAAVDHAFTVIDDGAVTEDVTVVDVTNGEPTDIVYITTGSDHHLSTGQTVNLSGIQGKTGLNHSWVISVVDARTFILNSSWGAEAGVAYTGGGLVTSLSSGSRSYAAVTNPPTLSLLLALGEGPIDAILTETIQINGQPLGNFPGVQIFTGMGHPDQPAYAEFGAARNTFSDGRPITAGTTVTYTTVQSVNAFTLNLTWEQGLFYVNDKGEKESNAVTLRYRFATQGSGQWSGWSQFQVVADRTSVVRMGIRREGLALLRYDVQIEYVAALQTDELHAKYEATLESVTEFIPDQFAYPNTALLGLKALATDALRGALPNITVVVRGLIVRVGTLGPVRTWSDNPAWCVMDFLTDLRYGMSVPLAEIDLTAFSVWAQYCDQIIQGERRHTLNYVLDREQRSQAILLEMMGGSRTMLLKSAGLWTPRVTRDDPPVRVLSWTSATNVQLTYIRDVDQINVMEARFSDESQDYEQNVLTWPDVSQWPGEVHKQSLDLRGVTSPSRVIRALQFELNRRRYENLLLEMDCAAEAIVLQPHDLFRFSHPLPGWGSAGRIQQGSSTFTLLLDEEVVIESGVAYMVYVRHEDDSTEIRGVVNVVLGPVRQLSLASVLSQVPVPRNSVWVFGTVATQANTRTFRVTSLQRNSDTTVHMQAIVHNPSIYDEATAQPLPPVSTLFNPLGAPPPLLSLIATELTRVQASGASLRVVNLSWDVAPLSTNYAPYGGATILRRSVLASGLAGQANAGAIDLGAIYDPNDPNANFSQIASVRGHLLDYDDPTVIQGATYIYRVIPLSQSGVPNQVGGRDVMVNVSGATTQAYFPGTPQNLRLKGQPVGVVLYEGRDIHVEWDPVPPSALFTETFFISDYVLQVWAPGQLYIMRSTNVGLAAPGYSATFSYTYEQNAEDQVRSGFPSARRDVLILVWARTNTGLLSLTPAALLVNNPPPDMSEIIPDTTPLFEAALINFNQWAEPRDFSHYEVHLDTVNPPIALYEEVPGIGAIVGVGRSVRKLAPQGLTPGVTYWTYILPFDTFGAGIPSQTVSFVPVSMTADKLDTTPPGTPTGLALSSGTEISADGTIQTFVLVSWTPNPEPDLAGYQLSVRIPPGNVPTTWYPKRTDTTFKIPNVPGFTQFFVRIAAVDRLSNISPFTTEVSITTAKDSIPPLPGTNLTAIGGVQKMHFLWTPPADLDYDHSEIWGSVTNNRANAGVVATGLFSAEQQGLPPDAQLFYWMRSVDTSGNFSTTFYPSSDTAGIPGFAGQLETQFIKSLAAEKILAGTISVLVNLGVAGMINLDGVQQYITIRELASGNFRVQLGRLGPLSSDWGIRIWNTLGQVMFDATDNGVTAFGIKAGVVNAGHIRTDTAVITVAAQIANALIQDAHIINVTASKLTAGSILATLALGVGNNIFIDGQNAQIRIFDKQSSPKLRVLIGNVAAGDDGWGMYIFNAAGNLMWDWISGAQNQGIANSAVDTPKITTNAVTESLAYSSITTLNVTTSDTVAATITFPEITAGDEVVLWASGSGTVALNSSALVMRIRENGVAGTELAYARAVGDYNGTVMTQAVWTAGASTSNKVFVITFRNESEAQNVALDHIKFTGLRRKR